jgi:hypothetical protein
MTSRDRMAAGVNVGGCDRVVYATAAQAAKTVEVCLRAAMLGDRDGHEVAAHYCSEHAAFHLSSRATRDNAPPARGIG